MTVTNLTQGRGVELVPAGYCRLMLQWQTPDNRGLDVVFVVTSESGEETQAASDACGYAEATVPAGTTVIEVTGGSVADYGGLTRVTRELEGATTHFALFQPVSEGGGGTTSLSEAVVELPASGWTDYAQSVAVDGVKADSLVWVTPAPGSWDRWGEAGVRCTSQSDGTLKFECQQEPSMDFEANVVIG